MTPAQKQTTQYELLSEKKVMEQLERSYQKALEDVKDIKCGKLETHLRQMMGGIIDVVLQQINKDRGTAFTRADVKMDFTRTCITNESDNAAIGSAEAAAVQIKVSTLLAAAAQLGVEAVLQPLCKVLELDEAEVRKSLEQTDGAQLDSLMQQLEEGAADDTGTEADHAV